MKSKKERVIVEFKGWEYTCGDRCCYDYGVKVYLNGEELEHPENTLEDPVDNSMLGDDTPNAVRAVLEKLGYNIKLIETHEAL